MATLTKDLLMEVWRTELLPSIRKEIKSQLGEIKSEIKDLRAKCSQIEKSQEYLSSKYDQVVQSIQTIKKQVDASHTKINQQDDVLTNVQRSMDDIYAELDEMQQYSRRDCLELNGIPQLDGENTDQLVIETASMIGVNLAEEDISISHRLPDTRNTKGRIIAKFVRREKRDEVYKNRRKLIKKSSNDIPSVKSANKPASKIHINESLTSYRRKLLGRINTFKKENLFKFIWTQNGKIYLKKHEDSRSYVFKTEEEFDEFMCDN